MNRSNKKVESVTTEKRKSTFNGSSVYETSKSSSTDANTSRYHKRLFDQASAKLSNLSNNGTLDRDRELHYSRCNTEEYDISRLAGNDSQDNKATVLTKQVQILIKTDRLLGQVEDKLEQWDRNGSPPGTTFKFYKQFDDYWNHFPKTDYTYSPTSEYYKMEIAPGIPMIPNLSRRPLRSTNSSVSNVIAPSQMRYFTANYYSESKWKRIVTTIRTIITTTITTTVTSVSDTIQHPTKSPLKTFLILFFLLALPLFYYLSYQDQNENLLFRLNESGFSQTKNAFQAIINSQKWLYSLLVNTFFFILDTITSVPVFIIQIFSMITTYLSTINHSTSQTYVTSELKTNYILPNNNFKIDALEIKNIVYQVLAEKNIKTTDFDADVIKKIVMEQYDVTKRDLLNQVIAEANTIMTNNLKKQEYAVISYMKGVTANWEKALLEHKETFQPQIEFLKEKIMNTHVQSSSTGELKAIENIDGSNQLSASLRQQLADLIDSELLKYHADRTGQADYALSSNGGMIISIKCTQTYTKNHGVMTVFGLNFYDVYSAPEIIIKPGTYPGECWAFEGSEGYVVIKLAIPVHVTAVTMEHTPKQLTPLGNIKSAPKQFSVWAVKDAFDNNPEFLGRFVYLDDRASLQTFNIEPTKSTGTEMIELRIESNHGHPEYTCLYRFRVHGMPVN